MARVEYSRQLGFGYHLTFTGSHTTSRYAGAPGRWIVLVQYYEGRSCYPVPVEACTFSDLQ